MKIFNISGPQTSLAEVHDTPQDCAEGNVKDCSSLQPDLKQQWLSEVYTLRPTKLWGKGWVCCFPEFSKPVFEIQADQILS